MTEKTNTSLEEIHSYKSPKTKVVFVKMQGILCGSEINGDANTTEMGEGDDNW